MEVSKLPYSDFDFFDLAPAQPARWRGWRERGCVICAAGGKYPDGKSASGIWCSYLRAVSIGFSRVFGHALWFVLYGEKVLRRAGRPAPGGIALSAVFPGVPGYETADELWFPEEGKVSYAVQLADYLQRMAAPRHFPEEVIVQRYTSEELVAFCVNWCRSGEDGVKGCGGYRERCPYFAGCEEDKNPFPRLWRPRSGDVHLRVSWISAIRSLVYPGNAYMLYGGWR